MAKANIIKLIDAMNKIRNSIIYEYLFVLFPYSITTGNGEYLKENIEKNSKISIDNEIRKYLIKYLENSK